MDRAWVWYLLSLVFGIAGIFMFLTGCSSSHYLIDTNATYSIVSKDMEVVGSLKIWDK